MGDRVSVFHAECQAKVKGLTLLDDSTEKLHVLVDNQAVVKSLENLITKCKSI